MRIVSVAVMLVFSSLSAFAATSVFRVKCDDLQDRPHGRVYIIEVETDAAAGALELAKYPADREKSPRDVKPYAITSSRNGLTEAVIEAERLTPDEPGQPAYDLMKLALRIDKKILLLKGKYLADLTWTGIWYDFGTTGPHEESETQKILCTMSVNP